MSNIYFCLVNVSEFFSRIRNICMHLVEDADSLIAL